MSSFCCYALALSAVLLVVGAEAPLPILLPARAQIPIVQAFDRRDDAGQFSLQYISADGSHFSEQGVLKPTEDGKDHVLVKKGVYGYTSPEGTPVRVSYYADETGFHPESKSIPIAPVDPARRV